MGKTFSTQRVWFKSIAIAIACLLLFDAVAWAHPDKLDHLAVQSIFSPITGARQFTNIGIIKYYISCLSKAPGLENVTGDVATKIKSEDVSLDFSRKDDQDLASLVSRSGGSGYIVPCKIHISQYYAYVTPGRDSEDPKITVYTKKEFKKAKEKGFIEHRERSPREEEKIKHQTDDAPLAILHGDEAAKQHMKALYEKAEKETLRYFTAFGAGGEFKEEARQFMKGEGKVTLVPGENKVIITIGGKEHEIPVTIDRAHASNSYINIPQGTHSEIVRFLIHELSAKCGKSHENFNIKLDEIYDEWRDAGEKIDLAVAYRDIASDIKTMRFKDLRRVKDRDLSRKKKNQGKKTGTVDVEDVRKLMPAPGEDSAGNLRKVIDSFKDREDCAVCIVDNGSGYEGLRDMGVPVFPIKEYEFVSEEQLKLEYEFFKSLVVSGSVRSTHEAKAISFMRMYRENIKQHCNGGLGVFVVQRFADELGGGIKVSVFDNGGGFIDARSGKPVSIRQVLEFGGHYGAEDNGGQGVGLNLSCDVPHLVHICSNGNEAYLRKKPGREKPQRGALAEEQYSFLMETTNVPDSPRGTLIEGYFYEKTPPENAVFPVVEKRKRELGISSRNSEKVLAGETQKNVFFQTGPTLFYDTENEKVRELQESDNPDRMTEHRAFSETLNELVFQENDPNGVRHLTDKEVERLVGAENYKHFEDNGLPLAVYVIDDDALTIKLKDRWHKRIADGLITHADTWCDPKTGTPQAYNLFIPRSKYRRVTFALRYSEMSRIRALGIREFVAKETKLINLWRRHEIEYLKDRQKVPSLNEDEKETIERSFFDRVSDANGIEKLSLNKSTKALLILTGWNILVVSVAGFFLYYVWGLAVPIIAPFIMKWSQLPQYVQVAIFTGINFELAALAGIYTAKKLMTPERGSEQVTEGKGLSGFVLKVVAAPKKAVEYLFGPIHEKGHALANMWLYGKENMIRQKVTRTYVEVILPTDPPPRDWMITSVAGPVATMIQAAIFVGIAEGLYQLSVPAVPVLLMLAGVTCTFFGFANLIAMKSALMGGSDGYWTLCCLIAMISEGKNRAQKKQSGPKETKGVKTYDPALFYDPDKKMIRELEQSDDPDKMTEQKVLDEALEELVFQENYQDNVTHLSDDEIKRLVGAENYRHFEGNGLPLYVYVIDDDALAGKLREKWHEYYRHFVDRAPLPMIRLKDKTLADKLEEEWYKRIADGLITRAATLRNPKTGTPQAYNLFIPRVAYRRLTFALRYSEAAGIRTLGIRDFMAKETGLINLWRRYEIGHPKDGEKVPSLTEDEKGTIKRSFFDRSPAKGMEKMFLSKPKQASLILDGWNILMFALLVIAGRCLLFTVPIIKPFIIQCIQAPFSVKGVIWFGLMVTALFMLYKGLVILVLGEEQHSGGKGFRESILKEAADAKSLAGILWGSTHEKGHALADLWLYGKENIMSMEITVNRVRTQVPVDPPPRDRMIGLVAGPAVTMSQAGMFIGSAVGLHLLAVPVIPALLVFLGGITMLLGYLGLLAIIDDRAVNAPPSDGYQILSCLVEMISEWKNRALKKRFAPKGTKKVERSAPALFYDTKKKIVRELEESDDPGKMTEHKAVNEAFNALTFLKDKQDKVTHLRKDEMERLVGIDNYRHFLGKGNGPPLALHVIDNDALDAKLEEKGYGYIAEGLLTHAGTWRTPPGLFRDRITMAHNIFIPRSVYETLLDALKNPQDKKMREIIEFWRRHEIEHLKERDKVPSLREGDEDTVLRLRDLSKKKREEIAREERKREQEKEITPEDIPKEKREKAEEEVGYLMMGTFLGHIIIALKMGLWLVDMNFPAWIMPFVGMTMPLGAITTVVSILLLMKPLAKGHEKAHGMMARILLGKESLKEKHYGEGEDAWIKIDIPPDRVKTEMWVAVAGPAFNIVLGYLLMVSASVLPLLVNVPGSLWMHVILMFHIPFILNQIGFYSNYKGVQSLMPEVVRLNGGRYSITDGLRILLASEKAKRQKEKKSRANNITNAGPALFYDTDEEIVRELKESDDPNEMTEHKALNEVCDELAFKENDPVKVKRLTDEEMERLAGEDNYKYFKDRGLLLAIRRINDAALAKKLGEKDYEHIAGGLITHAGTGRDPATGKPRTYNLFIPESVYEILVFALENPENHKARKILEFWRKHEFGHLKDRNNVPLLEPKEIKMVKSLFKEKEKYLCWKAAMEKETEKQIMDHAREGAGSTGELRGAKIFNGPAEDEVLREALMEMAENEGFPEVEKVNIRKKINDVIGAENYGMLESRGIVVVDQFRYLKETNGSQFILYMVDDNSLDKRLKEEGHPGFYGTKDPLTTCVVTEPVGHWKSGEEDNMPVVFVPKAVYKALCEGPEPDKVFQEWQKQITRAIRDKMDIILRGWSPEAWEKQVTRRLKDRWRSQSKQSGKKKEPSLPTETPGPALSHEQKMRKPEESEDSKKETGFIPLVGGGTRPEFIEWPEGKDGGNTEFIPLYREGARPEFIEGFEVQKNFGENTSNGEGLSPDDKNTSAQGGNTEDGKSPADHLDVIARHSEMQDGYTAQDYKNLDMDPKLKGTKETIRKDMKRNVERGYLKKTGRYLFRKGYEYELTTEGKERAKHISAVKAGADEMARELVDILTGSLLNIAINGNGKKKLLALDDNLGKISSVWGIIKEMAEVEGNENLKRILKDVIVIRGRGRSLAREVGKYIDGKYGEAVDASDVIMVANVKTKAHCGKFQDKAVITYVDDKQIDYSQNYCPLVEVILFTLARALHKKDISAYNEEKLKEIFETLNAEMGNGQRISEGVLTVILKPVEKFEYDELQHIYRSITKFLKAA